MLLTDVATAADSDRITGEILKIAGVVVLGAVMSILDITVVNVALPTFQTTFGSAGQPLAYSTVAWTVTGTSPDPSTRTCASPRSVGRSVRRRDRRRRDDRPPRPPRRG